MLRNPIHKRLERLEPWQLQTFMVCLCERMYPNYQAFALASGFGNPVLYRTVLDLAWEVLTVKGAKVNFENQLEKFEEQIPAADDFDMYGVFPAIDACVGLSDLLHSQLSGEELAFALSISRISINTVAMLEMHDQDRELSEEELKALPNIQNELDVQWEIYRLLAACEERDLELIKGLRADLREAGISNIGIAAVSGEREA
ncbi:DUF416 family protein [Plesiomonas shigelloides]|uniref:YjaG family protein n=1 Tax=Plesiomonas shigelloides TaxID=703 RepID=UPI001C0457B9|nr:DUF416 family protein [Plesiomonas shigelloides]QWK96897.1 DUF416 family protein [Plesiomonas shigelloides]